MVNLPRLRGRLREGAPHASLLRRLVPALPSLRWLAAGPSCPRPRTRRRRVTSWCVLYFVGVVACARHPAEPASSGSNAAAVATCSWPSIPKCTAGRYCLSCKDSNGGGTFCISRDATRCESPSPKPTPLTYASCKDECNAEEYGVVCGSPDPLRPQGKHLRVVGSERPRQAGSSTTAVRASSSFSLPRSIDLAVLENSVPAFGAQSSFWRSRFRRRQAIALAPGTVSIGSKAPLRSCRRRLRGLGASVTEQVQVVIQNVRGLVQDDVIRWSAGQRFIRPPCGERRCERRCDWRAARSRDRCRESGQRRILEGNLVRRRLRALRGPALPLATTRLVLRQLLAALLFVQRDGLLRQCLPESCDVAGIISKFLFGGDPSRGSIPQACDVGLHAIQMVVGSRRDDVPRQRVLQADRSRRQHWLSKEARCPT